MLRFTRSVFLLTLCSSAFLLACESDPEQKRKPSQVIVTLTTDLSDETRAISHVKVRVFGGPLPHHTELVHEEYFTSPVGEHFDRTFALAPSDGDASRYFILYAEAFTSESMRHGDLFTRLSVRGTYREERVDYGELEFSAACQGVLCPETETCVGGECWPDTSGFAEGEETCQLDEDCMSESECIKAKCFFGRCFAIPLTDEACEEGMPRVPRQFRCSDGSSIDRAYVCDGVANCATGSDEWYCADSFWDCWNGVTIPLWWVCDGVPHCEDESDEALCVGGLFQCEDGLDHELDVLCNGVAECPSDEADEVRCAYGPPQFICDDGWIKVMPHEVCDGVSQCLDGHDEAFCER